MKATDLNKMGLFKGLGLLLLAAAGVMTLDPVGRIPLTLLLTAATVAINAPALIKSLLGLLRHRRGERGCGE